MKILMSAYACEPHLGSEPGIGWSLALLAAEHHQVHVLTSQCHQAGIEAELARQSQPNLKFTYVDPLGWVYDWHRPRRTHAAVNLHYYLWQIRAYWTGRALHQQQTFDLVHHATYGRYYNPSFLALLPVPFVWGPLGGGEAAPQPFWSGFSGKNRLFETARDWIRGLGELDPFVGLTARHSAIAWAATQDTAQRMAHLGVPQVQVMSSLIWLNPVCRSERDASPDRGPRFLSIGRLLHWKGFALGLKAFAKANLANAEYWIIGTGPDQAALAALVADLGIEAQVKWLGKRPQNEVLDLLKQADGLIHPSLHDSGGFVCLEAMAMGCPVVCLDLGGPAMQVTAETGFKIAAHSPEQAVEDLSQALRQLADPACRARLSAAAGQHVLANFSPQQRGAELAQLYQIATGAAAPIGGLEALPSQS
jgi:glycosyltransferase involved in cell wall biosynthesis